MIEKMKEFAADKDAVLWAVAFVGVCVLVGLGKMKPEAVEWMLFAVVGRASGAQPKETK